MLAQAKEEAARQESALTSQASALKEIEKDKAEALKENARLQGVVIELEEKIKMMEAATMRQAEEVAERERSARNATRKEKQRRLGTSRNCPPSWKWTNISQQIMFHFETGASTA